jgi:copper chaperone NosL
MRILTPLSKQTRARLLLLAALGLSGCSDGPRAIQVGVEECAHCRMLISESRFASQLMTDRGRSYVFDSVECLAEFLDDEAEISEDRVRSLWVTDFAEPGSWIRAEEAHFLRSESIRSPMGLNLSAHGDEAAARRHVEEFGGELLNWAQVRGLVARMPVRGSGSHPAHSGGGDGH